MRRSCLRKWLADFNRWLFMRESPISQSNSDVPLLSLLVFTFIHLSFYFIIRLFYHTCFSCFSLLSFSIFSDVVSLCCLLWTSFVYILLVLYLTFLYNADLFKIVYAHVLPYFLCCSNVQLLTLNDPMSFYCFRLYFVVVSMATVYKQ